MAMESESDTVGELDISSSWLKKYYQVEGPTVWCKKCDGKAYSCESLKTPEAMKLHLLRKHYISDEDVPKELQDHYIILPSEYVAQCIYCSEILHYTYNTTDLENHFKNHEDKSIIKEHTLSSGDVKIQEELDIKIQEEFDIEIQEELDIKIQEELDIKSEDV